MNDNKHSSWYLTYVSKDGVSSVGDLLSNVFKIKFEERWSAYLGDYLLAKFDLPPNVTEITLKIRSNIDLDTEEPEEPDYLEFQTIIYLSNVKDELKEFIEANLDHTGLRKIHSSQI